MAILSINNLKRIMGLVSGQYLSIKYGKLNLLELTINKE